MSGGRTLAASSKVSRWHSPLTDTSPFGIVYIPRKCCAQSRRLAAKVVLFRRTQRRPMVLRLVCIVCRNSRESFDLVM